MHTLDYVVAKMSDPGEDFPSEFKPVLKVDEFKEIFNRVASATCNQLIKSNFLIAYTASIDILVKTLKQTAYYVLDEPVVLELYHMTKTNLKRILSEKPQPKISLFKHQAQIYLYMSKLLEEEGTDNSFKIDLINMLLTSTEWVDL